jgi:hypothetical protein
MPTYFSSDQVLSSFKRLASRKLEGKTWLERTSSLMYFLAFDAVTKKMGQQRLDFDPERKEGKENRRLIELEFLKLVLVDNRHGRISQVCELGKISKVSQAPEKRLSSNFLTVPLKKASQQAEPYHYPKRPSTPLIKMGQRATGVNWGMERHENWRENLPKFFSEVRTSTVFTDLAIFVMRDTEFRQPQTSNYVDVLSELLKERYSTELSIFWIEKIKKDDFMVKHITNPFSDTHESFLKKYEQSENRSNLTNETSKDERILYLEGLLHQHGITFNH